jgi:putative ABC transport system permease protein
MGHKILNDLWGNKLRTCLIVLSIAVGLFAVGTILSARTLLSTEMARSYEAILPSSGIIRTVQPFDDAFVRAVRGMDRVAEVEARRTMDVRVRTSPPDGPAGGETWLTLRIFAVADYDRIRVDKIRSAGGAWPPPEREILIERSALSLLNARVGDTLTLKLADDRLRTLRIAGLAHDMVQVPAQIDGIPYGYIAMDTLDWFGEPYGYNELHVVAVPPDNAQADAQEHARQVVNLVKDRAEKNGLTIPGTMTVEPGMLPLDDILQAILLLMGMLGLLSLFLSVFLIVNTVSALLAQQKRQIGVIKAVGATTGQLLGMYLAMVTIYGLLALAMAMPLSVLGARALSRFMAGLFNFDLLHLDIPPYVFAIQIAVGLLVPALASLLPFVANLRITPAQALSSYQMGKGRFGRNPIDHLLAGQRLWFARHVLRSSMRRPLLLSLRNTFRNKGRLAMTLITLSLAGAIFCGVFSVRASLKHTLDEIMRWWNFDVLVVLERPYRSSRVAQAAQDVPDVVETDVWFQLAARRVRPDGSESGTLMLFAPRPGSRLVPAPAIVAGRWLLPEDENAVVVTSIVLKEEEDLQVGDDIVLKVMGREQPYRVVGVCMGILTPMVYTNYEYVSAETGYTGQAGALLVDTQSETLPEVKQTVSVLETHLTDRGLRIADVQPVQTELEEAWASFRIIIALLLIMALLLAVVGGLGLMGTMSINVLERTREIGVLRAVGAPNRGVAGVFILEGVTIGVLSWAFGAVLAAPLGKLLSDAIGIPLVGTPLSFSYSLTGVWLWLGLVVLLSALASFWPARGASRLTVRQVLAYE